MVAVTGVPPAEVVSASVFENVLAEPEADAVWSELSAAFERSSPVNESLLPERSLPVTGRSSASGEAPSTRSLSMSPLIELLDDDEVFVAILFDGLAAVPVCCRGVTLV